MSAEEAYQLAKAEKLEEISRIRMLRKVYNMGLKEAWVLSLKLDGHEEELTIDPDLVQKFFDVLTKWEASLD